MRLLDNPVRTYAWGSTTAIPDLLGIAPTDEPQAELWIGAHPDSPSVLPSGESLDAAVAADPRSLLGADVERRFGRLPFLLKVLAAADALSLQVHPDADQAREGYDDEERRGVPAGAAHRRYRDPHHKPEMVVALTPFEALCGIRDVEATLADLHGLDVDHPAWTGLVDGLAAHPDAAGVTAVFRRLLSGGPDLAGLVDAVVVACRRRGADADAVVLDLAGSYPGDPGVVLSLLLHRVRLEPGEALHLPAGNVHAYLRGTAVEVMAASDNVLRAGLTPKFVDVDELLRIADLTPLPVPRVTAVRSGALTTYAPGADEFELVVADAPPAGTVVPGAGPRVVLVLSGEVEVADDDSREVLASGRAVLVADADGALRLSGPGRAVVARVPSA